MPIDFILSDNQTQPFNLPDYNMTDIILGKPEPWPEVQDSNPTQALEGTDFVDLLLSGRFDIQNPVRFYFENGLCCIYIFLYFTLIL